ncbi:hypothetical protein [Lysobacter xanthus]
MDNSALLDAKLAQPALAKRSRQPRLRLWAAAFAWLFYAPTVLMLSLSRGSAWLLFLLGWAASLVWVLSGYKKAFGRAFTTVHSLGLAVGLSVGIMVLAGSGLAGIMAAFGLLPSVSLGS